MNFWRVMPKRIGSSKFFTQFQWLFSWPSLACRCSWSACWAAWSRPGDAVPACAYVKVWYPGLWPWPPFWEEGGMGILAESSSRWSKPHTRLPWLSVASVCNHWLKRFPGVFCTKIQLFRLATLYFSVWRKICLGNIGKHFFNFLKCWIFNLEGINICQVIMTSI